jgi:hypothetical protein
MIKFCHKLYKIKNNLRRDRLDTENINSPRISIKSLRLLFQVLSIEETVFSSILSSMKSLLTLEKLDTHLNISLTIVKT